MSCAPAPLCPVLASSASDPSPRCSVRAISPLARFFSLSSSVSFYLLRLLSRHPMPAFASSFPPDSSGFFFLLFPPDSFFFSAGCHPASPSSIMPDVIRLRAVYLRCFPSLNLPIPPKISLNLPIPA